MNKKSYKSLVDFHALRTEWLIDVELHRSSTGRSLEIYKHMTSLFLYIWLKIFEQAIKTHICHRNFKTI